MHISNPSVSINLVLLFGRPNAEETLENLWAPSGTAGGQRPAAGWRAENGNGPAANLKQVEVRTRPEFRTEKGPAGFR